MNISRFFIERPIATSLLMAGIIVMGCIAYPQLPISALPQVEFPTVQVSASLPGASPETMASSVATPLERQFAQISGVTQLTSSSGFGLTNITAQFDLNRAIDGAAADIHTAINAASGQLPKNMPAAPTFKKTNPADSPIMNIFVSSDLYPLTTVDDLTDTIIAQQISQVSGIAQVNIYGEQKPSVRVQINPEKLASLGMSMEDVRGTLASASVDGPKGNFDGERQAFSIYDNDQILKAAPYNDLVLAYRNGAPIRVRDVGRAIDAAENTKIGAWHGDGRQGVLLVITKQPGANVIDAVDAVRAALPRLQAALPPGIDVDVIIDRTHVIRASVSDVQFTLLLTIALVVMVIFLFLRNFWATAIPSLIVPLSLVGTFAMMYLVGYSLDNLSLMALTISVGFVVDDAIVMIENIYRHVEEGMEPYAAAIKGSGEIGFTIISISFSLVAVFIPLLFMSGVVGRLFREFAITVTMTIVVSAFVSLTLTPMMCARLLKDEKHITHGALYMAVERFFDLVLRGYDVSLQWVLRHQRVTLISLLATMAATVYLYVIAPKGFFPQQDTGYIQATSEMGQDVSFAEARQKHFAVADILAKDPDIDQFAYTVGPTGGSQSMSNGRFWINLKPHEERAASADQVIARLRPKLAQVEGITMFMQAQQDLNVGGRAGKTQYQYTLQDANLAELLEWAPRLLDKIRTLPQVRDVATDLQTNATAAVFTIDRDTASRFGIQPQLIDDIIYDSFGQRQAVQMFTQLNQYHVVLEVDPRFQADPTAFERIFVKSPATGKEVPLSAFVKLDTSKTKYLTIAHQGQFPAVMISFNLGLGVALGDAIDAIKRAEGEIGKPGTLTASFQGSAQVFQSSLASQPYLIAAAMIAVYIILGMLYESYVHPITILSTIPSAGVGALLILMASGYDLNVIALIGIILLIGIVKKNAIMMIDFALAAERGQGMSPRDSIYQACLLRFRPIMMTTMAALLGGLPLMLGHGTGSEIRRPLGYAIVGGLLLSQVLTLYTTPVVYLYLDRLRDMFGNKNSNRLSRLHEALTPHAAE
jgi:HAE1 family hydrophobic/amphiphilic exporter-1/multidrug efflux pump